ncbi:hypothetical protein KR018_006848 [Drosophila ironensis]|nr:hypothetical protein KR018_006848 [Drosophila ironensis]
MADSYSNVLPSMESPDLSEWSSHGWSWRPQLWSNIGLFTSLISPLLLPESERLPTPRQILSSAEQCPLSDDEKRERLRLQELMRNREHAAWEEAPDRQNLLRDEAPPTNQAQIFWL